MDNVGKLINKRIMDLAINTWIGRVRKNILLLVKPHTIWEIYDNLEKDANDEIISIANLQLLQSQQKEKIFEKMLASPKGKHFFPKNQTSAKGLRTDIEEFLGISPVGVKVQLKERYIVLAVTQTALISANQVLRKYFLEMFDFCKEEKIHTKPSIMTAEMFIFLTTDVMRTVNFLNKFFYQTSLGSKLPFSEDMIIAGIRIVDMVEKEEKA